MSKKPHNSTLKTSYSLIERVQNPDDDEAWKEFVDYYYQYIYNILRCIKIPEVDSKEILNDIVLKLWKKLPELVYDKDRGKFRHWLGAVIRNEANQYYNKKKSSNKLFSNQENEILQSFEDPKGNKELDSIIINEWNEYISNLAWESIKDRFRENVQQAFMMHVDGKSSKEISVACDVKQNSVNVYIKRVRAHLKEKIRKLNQELL